MATRSEAQQKASSGECSVIGSPKFRFGSFAVLPDHTALGVQAANILFELQENEWQVGDKELEEPVAVEKVLLVPFAEKYMTLKDNALDQIDVQVE